MAWQAYVELWKKKLEAKSVQMDSGCIIWQGTSEDKSRSKNGSLLYGIITAKLPNETKIKRLRVHRVAYFNEHFPNYDLYDCLPISHICHNSLCINPNHLSREEQLINNQRKKCIEQGVCCCHGNHPDCIL